MVDGGPSQFRVAMEPRLLSVVPNATSNGVMGAMMLGPRAEWRPYLTALTLDADSVGRMIDVNVRGAYFGSVGAARLMPEGGRILVIGSDTADSMPFPGLAAYGLTKGRQCRAWRAVWHATWGGAASWST